MQIHSQRLVDGRWGIYEKRRLLATVGCAQACEKIIDALKQRQPKQPLLSRSETEPEVPLEGQASTDQALDVSRQDSCWTVSLDSASENQYLKDNLKDSTPSAKGAKDEAFSI